MDSSSFLDYHLRQIIPTIPNILEDTGNKSRINALNNIPTNAILVTFDVVRLSPHIPHDQKIGNMGSFLDKREDKSYPLRVFVNLLESFSQKISLKLEILPITKIRNSHSNKVCTAVY